MPYTIEDFKREVWQEALDEMPVAKRLEGIPLEKRLEGVSVDELEALLNKLNNNPPESKK